MGVGSSNYYTISEETIKEISPETHMRILELRKAVAEEDMTWEEFCGDVAYENDTGSQRLEDMLIRIWEAFERDTDTELSMGYQCADEATMFTPKHNWFWYISNGLFEKTPAGELYCGMLDRQTYISYY